MNAKSFQELGQMAATLLLERHGHQGWPNLTK
jgi:hypothetical protein